MGKKNRMADKKKSRSEKMYSDSPKISTDESGKKVITKAEKKSAEVNSGTDGIPEHEKHAMELAQKHEKERLDLHHQHEKAHHELSAKHLKEHGHSEPKKEEHNK